MGSRVREVRGPEASEHEYYITSTTVAPTLMNQTKRPSQFIPGLGARPCLDLKHRAQTPHVVHMVQGGLGDAVKDERHLE